MYHGLISSDSKRWALFRLVLGCLQMFAAEFDGIRLVENHTAVGIDPKAKTVLVRDSEQQQRELSYEQLVIGTGAEPVTPRFRGKATFRGEESTNPRDRRRGLHRS
jgi:NADPH-dependent 2,4-dienoyl-CoA reductase/sulfur reductase-like enzyme